MNLYQLNYFRTLAKLQHCTKAATNLCITQPSLSHSISALESEIGVPLFEKQGRNIVLTEQGRVFLTYVEKALSEIETGINKVREFSADTEGKINIGFIYTLSAHFIPNLVGQFKKDNQNLNVEFLLREGTTLNECTHGLVRDLKAGNLDLIFVSLIPKDTDVEFIPLGEQKLVAILPYDSPLASQESVDLKELEPYKLIHYSDKPGLKQEINRLFLKVNLIPKVACEVENEISMSGLVVANVGIAIAPDSPIFHNFPLKVLPIRNPVYTRMIYLGHMKNRHESMAVRQVKNYVLNYSKDIIKAVYCR